MLRGLWQTNCGFLTARAVVPRILRNEHRLEDSQSSLFLSRERVLRFTIISF